MTRNGGDEMNETMMEVPAGRHIRDAIREAMALAEAGEVVRFDFNGIEHEVRPGESYEVAKARAEERTGRPILSAEAEAEQARDTLERMEREQAEAIATAGVATEAELRNAEVPWLKDPDELAAYIASLVDRPHDYGTCVYAMSMAATAAFQYVAGRLGVSGFQASCADMDILRRTRHLKHGFRIVSYEDLLFPQYWDAERTPIFEAALKEDRTRTSFATEARKLLAESPGAHPDVTAHWERIASLAPTTP